MKRLVAIVLFSVLLAACQQSEPPAHVDPNPKKISYVYLISNDGQIFASFSAKGEIISNGMVISFHTEDDKYIELNGRYIISDNQLQLEKETE